jgi:FtsZ-binding cell division protein ZapB
MPKSPKKPTIDLLLSEIEKLKEAIKALEEHRDEAIEKFDELNRFYDISDEDFAKTRGWSSVLARDSRNIHRRLDAIEENAGIKVHRRFKEGANEMYDRFYPGKR